MLVGTQIFGKHNCLTPLTKISANDPFFVGIQLILGKFFDSSSSKTLPPLIKTADAPMIGDLDFAKSVQRAKASYCRGGALLIVGRWRWSGSWDERKMFRIGGIVSFLVMLNFCSTQSGQHRVHQLAQRRLTGHNCVRIRHDQRTAVTAFRASVVVHRFDKAPVFRIQLLDHDVLSKFILRKKEKMKISHSRKELTRRKNELDKKRKDELWMDISRKWGAGRRRRKNLSSIYPMPFKKDKAQNAGRLEAVLVILNYTAKTIPAFIQRSTHAKISTLPGCWGTVLRHYYIINSRCDHVSKIQTDKRFYI
uniref:Uncharacterized protein n=1 Tax=Romanomermis culicivorax TaxID=13658 RepID=A0A915I997_ROMCU